MDVYESILVNIGFISNNYFETITPERLNKYTDLAYSLKEIIDITNGDVYHTTEDKVQSHLQQVLEQWVFHSVGQDIPSAKVEYFKSATPDEIEAFKETTYIFNVPFLPWSTNYFEQEDGSIIAKIYEGKYYRSPLAKDQLLLKAQSMGIILLTLYGTYKGIKLLKNKVF